jgi:hypothetical protein
LTRGYRRYRHAVNVRRLAVADRVLALADDVTVSDPALAARQRECVPDGSCPLSSVAAGQVWIAEDAVVADQFSAYSDDASWWLDQGPEDAPLDEVMRWALKRSDDGRAQRRYVLVLIGERRTTLSTRALSDSDLAVA